MIRGIRGIALFGLAMALVAQPAAACWNNSEQDAAKISHFNMMLMVNALRCRGGRDNYLVQYNQFVKRNNAILGTQNAVIKAHFIQTFGAKGAESAMDKMVIGYANQYGAGHPNMGCHELKAVAVDVASGNQGVASLRAIADKTIMASSLPGGSCSATIAARK